MNLKETFTTVQAASRKLALLDDQTINRILNAVADAAIAETPFILSENEVDGSTAKRNCSRYSQRGYPPLAIGTGIERNRPPQWNETDKGLCPVRCHRHHL